MIPFSIEFEQELWDMRDNPEGLKALLAEAEGAKSILPKMITTGYACCRCNCAVRLPRSCSCTVCAFVLDVQPYQAFD